MKIEVGGVTFASQKAVTAHCRAITARYGHKGKVTGAEDDAFLRALTKRHPHAKEKIGVGIAYFKVQCMPPYLTSLGLALHRTDRSKTDMSYTACISGPKPWADFGRAARYAVGWQIADFKAAAFAGGQTRCPLSGEEIFADNCHVDHFNPSFQTLLKDYLAETGTDWRDVKLTPHSSGAGGYEFAHQEDDDEFAAYHAKHAQLRVLSPRSNLSRARDD